MTADAWITIGVLVAAVVAMARQILTPAAGMLGATGVLLLARVIDADAAFSGFSNPAPITVALLYVVADAASRTGLLSPLVATALGSGRQVRRGLARILPPVAAASAFMNNSPIVAMLVPQVTSWASRHERPPSHWLMPISFAAILGGTITVIGTSTNVLVSGLLEDRGLAPLGFFELAPVGGAATVLGLGILVLLAPRLLPERTPTRDDLGPAGREFVISMVVDGGGPLDGMQVEEGGLRHLNGVFLVAIERAEELIAPVRPTTQLRGGDRLRFAGRVDRVTDLMSLPGLSSSEHEQFSGFDSSRLTFYEAVLGAQSPLVGRSLKGARFRGRYQAAVIAIHRAGHRVEAKLGEVPLRVGDTLMLVADPGFGDRWRHRTDFLLVSPVGRAEWEPRPGRGVVATVAVAMVVAAATGVLPLVHAAVAAAMAVVAFRILSPGEAKNAVDLDVVLTMAGGFGLGSAMQESGLAGHIADGLVGLFGPLGSLGALFGVVAATLVLTELVSNTAAALLVFPIAVATAAGMNMAPRGMVIAIAVAASASFLTPIGYQTNTMVYGPGGYRFGDYARLGFPLALGVTGVILAVVPVVWPF